MADQQTLVAPVGAERASARRRVLDLGCGRNKQPGAIGVDRDPASQADLLCDLNRVPYPFRADSFDEIHLYHVIEHLTDVVAVVAEIWRIARQGARVFIATPHFSS
ncbi:MAG: methyltransferase domain-containing protein, partial [candidate division NC10 bacterium]|nr:methyltransferase domain-containing protein [candidate division NC10 bacterium]